MSYIVDLPAFNCTILCEEYPPAAVVRVLGPWSTDRRRRAERAETHHHQTLMRAFSARAARIGSSCPGHLRLHQRRRVYGQHGLRFLGCTRWHVNSHSRLTLLHWRDERNCELRCGRPADYFDRGEIPLREQHRKR